MLTIVELPDFQRLWPHYWSEDEYFAFTGFIATNPDAGVVVPKSGGVRKVRWARKGSGKSGGVRVIYFTRTAAGQIILLTIYAKATTANLTPDQLKELRYDYEKNLASKR